MSPENVISFSVFLAGSINFALMAPMNASAKVPLRPNAVIIQARIESSSSGEITASAMSTHSQRNLPPGGQCADSHGVATRTPAGSPAFQPVPHIAFVGHAPLLQPHRSAARLLAREHRLAQCFRDTLSV